MLEDFFRLVLNVPPSQRRIQMDLANMSKETAEWRQQVIPWEEEKELELFSLNHETKVVKHGWDRILKGCFKSIYNEPVMTFALKKYRKDGGSSLLYCATMAHEFIYRGRKKRTDFFIDGQHVGYITPDGKMYGGKKNRLLGRQNRLNSEYDTIVIWDREVAHLLNPLTSGDRVNPRAFEVMESNMTDQEELLLLSLAFHSIVFRTLRRDD